MDQQLQPQQNKGINIKVKDDIVAGKYANAAQVAHTR